MPFWLQLGLGLLGLWQAHQQARRMAEAERLMREGGLSPEELKEMERLGMARMHTILSRRGVLDSGLLAGGHAALQGELALAKARGRLPFQQSYLNYLLQRSQQPTLLSQLVPLLMQYGAEKPGGGWWIRPAVQVTP